MHKFCMGVSSCSSALVWFWISSALIAHSQGINAPKHVEQWGIEEVTVRSAHPYDNPFKEVRLAVVVFLLLVLANVGVHAQEAYQLLSNASTTHYELAYLAMFAVPLAGRAALRRRLPLSLKLTSVAGFIATLFSLIISAYPFVKVVDAKAYAIKIVGTVLVSNCGALAFYWVRTSSRTRKQIQENP